MIREMGNVELFELCETVPKVQCSHCLLYWNQGIVYCTCGQFLIDSESRRKFDKLRLDATIPDYVVKARHGKTEVQREYHIAWNAWKRCCKKVDSQGEHFYRYSWSIPQRFSLSWITTRNRMDRTSVQRVGRTCKIRPHIVSLQRKKRRCQGQWYLTLNKSGNKWAYEGSIRFSSCCLCEKSSTPRVRRTSWRAYFSRTIQDMASLFKHIVLGQVWNWKWARENFFKWCSSCYSWFRLQSMAIHFTRHFSLAVHTFNYMHITLHGSRRATQCVCVRASFHLHAIHDVCLIVRWLLALVLSFSCFSLSFTSSLPHPTCTLPGTSLRM